MPSIGWPELLIVLVIALVIFGPKRLPDMGRQLGKGLREFKKATNEIQGHFDLSLEEKDDKKTKKSATDTRPAPATTVPVAEASVAQVTAPETAGADAAGPATEMPVAVDAETPVAVDAETPVAVDAETPAPAETEKPEVIEGEVVAEEADHPAQTVAG